MSDRPEDGPIHVVPADDLIEHDESWTDCVCGPKAKAQRTEDGQVGWIIVHNSLDGREADEITGDGSGTALPPFDPDQERESK